MKITKANALHLWNQRYGNVQFAKDFHGNLMCRSAYGNDKYYIVRKGQKIFCGWNLHHILPVSIGGNNDAANLLCTNIITNTVAEDKITFWIDKTLYQVQRIFGTSNHEIKKLR